MSVENLNFTSPSPHQFYTPISTFYDGETPEFWQTWLFGLLIVTAASFLSPTAILIIPLLNKSLYEHCMVFLVALGIGAMSGSCIFILIPQAFNITEVQKFDYVTKSWLMISALYAFFTIDRILQCILEFRRRRNNRRKIHTSSSTNNLANIGNNQNGEKKMEESLKAPMEIMPKIFSETRQQSDREVTVRKNGFIHHQHSLTINEDGNIISNIINNNDNENGLRDTNIVRYHNAGENGHNNKRPCSRSCSQDYSPNCHNRGHFITSSFNDRRKSSTIPCNDDFKESEAEVIIENARVEDNLTELNNKSYSNSILSTTTTGTATTKMQNGMNQSEQKPIYNEIDIAYVSIEVHEKPKKPRVEVASVAYMILFGSSANNFVDGMSTGAAFSDSIIRGITIGLAVLSQQFPQELGTLAILIKSGLGIRRALLYNMIPIALSYVGFAFGVFLDTIDDSYDSFIFSISAGMYFYIFLGTLIPEIRESFNDVLGLGVWEAFLCSVLQFSGISFGIAFLYFMN